MKKKQLYETPSVETYDLVPQGTLLIVSNGANYGTQGSAGGTDSYNDIPVVGGSNTNF